MLIAVCILLAWLTKILIEDPARTWTFLTVRRPRVTAQYSLAIMAVSALLVGAAFVVNNPKYEGGRGRTQPDRREPAGVLRRHGGTGLRESGTGGCHHPESRLR